MYKGREGMWSWILHRVAGLGILLFLLLHIVDIALINWGAEAFDKMLFLYRNPVFMVFEVGLIAAVLFHALNGIRVIVIDFWPGATDHQRTLFYAELVVFFLLFIPAAFMMLRGLVHAT